MSCKKENAPILKMRQKLFNLKLFVRNLCLKNLAFNVEQLVQHGHLGFADAVCCALVILIADIFFSKLDSCNSYMFHSLKMMSKFKLER